MAEIKLTEAQQAVVDNRGGALLVSAAAGSGKTRVLVDRLMKYVCDPDAPTNLDEFLIITFTKAAAAELRGKIAQELSARLAEDPENMHLQRQSARLSIAQISTVHAFCSAILRAYAHLLDVPADFRVAEEQEAKILREELVQDVLDELYTQVGLDDTIKALIDHLGYGRDDRRLGSVLLDVYEKIRCRPNPIDWMEACEDFCAQIPEKGAEDSYWGRWHLSKFYISLQSICEMLQMCIDEASCDPVLSDKYVPVLQENLQQVIHLSAQASWDDIYQNRIKSFGTLRAAKDADEDVKEHVKEIRKLCLTRLQEAQEPFYAPSEQVLDDLRSCSAPIIGLLRLVTLFDKRYSAEKRRRKIFDFSDLEHETIRLLTDSGGRPTEAAREIAAHYKEILVDEFQDSNAVQEYIYEAISRAGENRFMVGDVKQSIYSFRLAQPQIFLDKYDAYQPYDEALPHEPRKILLSENFRSRWEILEAVNDVFSLIMNRSCAELDYGEDEKLRAGRAFPELPQAKVELHCIDTVYGSQYDRVEVEADFVASRIAQMLTDGTQISDGDTLRAVTPSDIVILLRSPGTVASVYADALLMRGVPCFCEQSADVLDSTEAEVMTAMLSIIDNPHRDIELATVLASPVFCFTPDELARFHAENSSLDLYDSLCNASVPSEKLTAFLQWHAQMRADARHLSVRELYDKAIATTKADDIFGAMADGRQRAENLQALRSVTDQFSRENSGGLSAFVRHIARMLETQTPLAVEKKDAAGNAVRIMSIHHSKGLEFPVVFLADLARKINLQDSTDAVLLDDYLWIGCDVVDTKSRHLHPSIAKLAISKVMTERTIAEEMRVLYVAMTRAQQMLVMSYCSSTAKSSLKKWNNLLGDTMLETMPSMARSLGDWILMQALCRTEAGELFAVTGPNSCSGLHDDVWHITFRDLAYEDAATNDELQIEENAPDYSADVAAMDEVLNRYYAYENAQRIPSKLTATQLKGRYLDHEAAEAAVQTYRASSAVWREPNFLPKTELTGSEKGTAVHYFMQYARYQACASREGIEQEKQRLVRECFLTPMQAQAVDAGGIEALFSSELGARILSCRDICREFKFSILCDAAQYYPDAPDEQVMLQGVVDCFWQEDDGLVIVDFKTDRIVDNLEEKVEIYRPQLQAYAQALSRIYQMPVKEKILYFFDCASAVSV